MTDAEKIAALEDAGWVWIEEDALWYPPDGYPMSTLEDAYTSMRNSA